MKQDSPDALRAIGRPPARRVVLLGASNLTKSIGNVLATSTQIWGEPLQVLAALGHGRSYGRETRFFGMKLPGIESCGLWRDLAADSTLPTAALVTDIGNDLLYEEPVATIAEWVERCFDRLSAAGAQTVVTQLPIENLKSLSPARFFLLRTLFFPTSRIGLSEVADRARQVNEHVRRLAGERAFPLVEHRSAWYGFDPIHVRFRHRRGAWHHILSNWDHQRAGDEAGANSLWRTLFLRTRTPERRSFLGIEQRGRKPSAVLRDGTRVAFY